MSTQRAAQLVEAGVWLQATGDADGARRLFEQALRIDPQNARALQFLGKAAPPPAAPSPGVAAPRGAPVPGPAAGAMPVPVPETTPSGGTVVFGAGQNPLWQGSPPPRPATLTPNPFVRPDSLTPRPATAPSTLHYGVPANAPPPASEIPEAIEDDQEGWSSPAASPVRAAPAAASAAAPPPELGEVAFEPARDAWETTSLPDVQVLPTPPRRNDPMELVTQAHTPVPFKDPRLRDPSPSEKIEIQQEVETLLRGARDLVELDDHSGAIDLIQKALELAPLHPNALTMKQNSELKLLAMYESRLGGLSAQPRVVLKQDDIIWLNLDHRAGFVLAQIDGSVSYDDLFAICGMSRLDTARILAQLVEEGVIQSEHSAPPRRSANT